VDAEIEQASAARFRLAEVPRLAGPIGVVEGQVDGVQPAERAARDQIADAPGRLEMAIREIDGEPAVVGARALDDGGGLDGRARQRLLAEDGAAGFEREHRFARVAGARRRDDHAVGAMGEQIVQRAAARRVRRDGGGGIHRGGIDVRDRHDLGAAGGGDRLQAVAADPAEAEEGESGARHHIVTTALRKPSGRSRIHANAVARPSSPMRWVNNASRSRTPRWTSPKARRIPVT